MTAAIPEGWLDISSVPRNEPVILARKRGNGDWEVVAGFYDEGCDVLDYPWSYLDPDCVGSLNAFHEDSAPAYWQPLPSIRNPTGE